MHGARHVDAKRGRDRAHGHARAGDERLQQHVARAGAQPVSTARRVKPGLHKLARRLHRARNALAQLSAGAQHHDRRLRVLAIPLLQRLLNRSQRLCVRFAFSSGHAQATGGRCPQARHRRPPGHATVTSISRMPASNENPDLLVVGGGVIGLSLAWRARELEPALAPTIRLGLELPDDRSVDPRRVITALRRACALTGVRLRERAPVERVLQSGATASGVELEGGEQMLAGAVVVATGAWKIATEGVDLAAELPVRPVKGQTLRLRDPAGPGLLTRSLRFAEGYLVPRRD